MCNPPKTWLGPQNEEVNAAKQCLGVFELLRLLSIIIF